MFIVIKSEHYDCTNLICKKDTLEEAVAAVKDSMAQRINKNYHAGLTGTDITHENEDHYGFSFTFDENRHADSSEPRAYSTYDYWNGDTIYSSTFCVRTIHNLQISGLPEFWEARLFVCKHKE